MSKVKNTISVNGNLNECVNKLSLQKINAFRPLQPCLPKNVDPQELTFIEDDSYYIIPEGIRPVLKTFRIEVSIMLLLTCYTCVELFL